MCISDTWFTDKQIKKQPRRLETSTSSRNGSPFFILFVRGIGTSATLNNLIVKTIHALWILNSHHATVEGTKRPAMYHTFLCNQLYLLRVW